MTDERPSLNDVMTHEQLAKLLGIKPKALSMYAIKHARLGDQRIYFQQDVAEWLEARRDGRDGQR